MLNFDDATVVELQTLTAALDRFIDQEDRKVSGGAPWSSDQDHMLRVAIGLSQDADYALSAKIGPISVELTGDDIEIIQKASTMTAASACGDPTLYCRIHEICRKLTAAVEQKKRQLAASAGPGSTGVTPARSVAE